MVQGLWMTYYFSGVKSTLLISLLYHFLPCMVISFFLSIMMARVVIFAWERAFWNLQHDFFY